MDFRQKIPWTKQPQYPVGVDRSNPLSKGLVEIVNPLSLTQPTTIRGYTPTVSAGTIAGGVGRCGRNITLTTGTNDSGLIIAADGDDLFPSSTDATIFVVRRSKDTTARNSVLFGYQTSATDRVLCHGPYGDGIMYFDFGSNVTANRITASFTKSTDVEYLVFVAGGGKGREIWRNGAKIAGDATKTGSRAATAANFRIGSCISTLGSDNDEVYLFGVANRAWSDAEIVSWSRNPWQIFQPLSRSIYVASAGGGGVASGDAVFTSSIVGASANDQAASGNAVFTSSIVGESAATAAASGDAVFTSSVVGASSSEAVASGNVVFTSSIAGDSAVGGQGAASGDVVFTSSIVGASSAEASASGDIVFTAGFVAAAPATTGGGIGHGGKKKSPHKPKRLWIVQVDDKELEVNDLEEVMPLVAKKLVKGITPKVIARPSANSERKATEAYSAQNYLTQHIPMPAYDKRLDFINILPYILAMQEMEAEEEELLQLVA